MTTIPGEPTMSAIIAEATHIFRDSTFPPPAGDPERARVRRMLADLDEAAARDAITSRALALYAAMLDAQHDGGRLAVVGMAGEVRWLEGRRDGGVR